jgi:hypothetical protein
VDVAVLYHEYCPYGPEPLDRFTAAYGRHNAGVDHELAIVVRNKAGGSDLGDYRIALGEVEADVVCFLSCHSEPLHDGWLAQLIAPLEGDVGIVGATGSYEGANPPPSWPLPTVPFPNPHIRSTGFAMRRAVALELDWDPNLDKPGAWALECGVKSLTRQIKTLDQGARVVGRDGVYRVEDWRKSRTYRAGEQENLLIGDNRTRDYQHGDADQRRRLERLAWGSTAAS